MKKILLIILILSNSVFATETEKEAKSKITSATVFLNGAQVTRESNVTLNKGKTILKFKELSPYINKNSIRVKGIGNITILSVNQRINHIKKTELSSESKTLNSQIEKLTSDIEFKKTEMNILKEKKEFLLANKKIIGSDKALTPNDFKLFKDIYSSGFETIEISILKKHREIDELEKKIKTLNKQVNEASIEKEMPTSEITVVVSSEIDSKAKITLNYYVSNAGWFPSYDLRVNSIDSPMKLSYKANVYQNTGVDWNNINLKFSNASPSESANYPILYPYYLNFNNYTVSTNNYSKYNPYIREVTGIVRDEETGESVPFVNIKIKDKTIGTTTDIDGKFSLTIPVGAKSLVVSYIGYETKEVTISKSYIDIPLKPSSEMIQEVVVTAVGISKMSKRSKRKNEAKPIPVKMKTEDYKTNFEFNIDIPYSLKSNASNLTIEMKEIELSSSYVYKSIPKINQKAFLIANIVNWEQHSLLDGEVNLYFEKTFVGKSVLDLSQLGDTLEVSLGADKNITIKRNEEKLHTSKQFFGGNKIETRVWKTTIRNNKSEKIAIRVYDQIPISNDQEIIVESENISDGKINKETGEVEWEIELAPKETIEKTIEYKVKYPKKKFLRIE